MQETNKKTSIWTMPFISIFLMNLILQMGQYMMNSLVPKYAHFLGAGAATVGTVSSMFAVTALAVRPISGPAIDCFSKKRMLVISAGIIFLAFLIYGLSSSIPMLIFGRLIHGIGIGMIGPLALATAGECLPEEKMSSGIGIFALGQAAATALGPSAGLALSQRFGYSATFFICSGIAALSCVPTLALTKTKTGSCKKPYRISTNNIFAKETLTSFSIILFLGISYSCINSYMIIYGSARGITQIGLFFTAYAAALLISRPLSGVLSDKYGIATTLIPGFLLFAAAFFLISYSSTLTMFIIAGVVSAFGYGTITPNIQAMGMRKASPERRGVVANTIYMGMDIGVLLGGPISGLICEYVQKATGDYIFGYSAMYRVMIIPVAISATAYAFSLKKSRRALRNNTECFSCRTDVEGEVSIPPPPDTDPSSATVGTE